MTRNFPSYVYDYCAELFLLPPNDNKVLHHRYITYNQKLKGYPRGFKKEDFSKFNLTIRRLLIRWEKKVENHIAMLHYACAWITYRRARVFG